MHEQLISPLSGHDNLLEGLTLLKRASLYLMFGALVGGVGSLVGFSPQVRANAAALEVLIILVVVGFIIVSAGLFKYLVPAFDSFALHDRNRFHSPRSMVRKGYVWGLLITFAAFLLLSGGALAHLAGN